MRLRDIDPATLGQQAHEHVVERVHGLLAAIDPMALPPPLDGRSEVRRAVTLLAHYARTGEPPEGRRELVHDYLVSLIPAGLLPDTDPPDEPPTEDRTEAAVHRVVLAVLAREAIAEHRGVPTAWLAAVADTQPSYVRRLVSSGELRTWRRGVEDRAAKTRTYVHPDDAARWLESRKPS